MFEQALETIVELPASERSSFIERLNDVRAVCDFGYGVGDTMDHLLAKHLGE